MMFLKARLGAYRMLFKHFGRVSRQAWNARHLTDVKGLSQEEAQFLPALLSVQESPVSPAARWLGHMLIAMVLLLLAWAIFGRVDIVVNAQGKVIPSARVKEISVVETSRVRTIYVKEGQLVQEGQPLIELESNLAENEGRKSSDELSRSLATESAANALIGAAQTGVFPKLKPDSRILEPELLAAQRAAQATFNDHLSKVRKTQAELQRLQAARPTLAKQVADYAALLPTAEVSRHAYYEKELALINVDGQIQESLASLVGYKTELNGRAHEQLREAQRSANVAMRELDKSKIIVSNSVLNAPVAGRVQQMVTNTVGGVVQAAQVIMRIVPLEKVVEIEAMVPNRDIGFVRMGHEVAVKLEAYDYTRYGTLAGVVTHIAADAIDLKEAGLMYEVRVKLNTVNMLVNGQEKSIFPGLAGNVEIKTGERRIIQYVLSPLVQYTQESLRER